MKYRIKIYTFENGRQEFKAQVKKGLFWIGLYYDGEDSIFANDNVFNTREKALDAIDKHHAGNAKIKSIEIEYINK